jgi:hypothetical protein
VSKLDQYRYKITGAVGLFIVAILYLTQPTATYTPHGIVWPAKGITMLKKPTNTSKIKVAPYQPREPSSSIIVPPNAKLLGSVNVFMHDSSRCSTAWSTNPKLWKSSACKESVKKKIKILQDKEKSLASTLPGANTIRFNSYMQRAPSLQQGRAFAEWSLHGVVLDVNNKGAAHNQGAQHG